MPASVGIRKSPSGLVIDPRAYSYGDVDTPADAPTLVPEATMPIPRDSSVRGEVQAVGQVAAAGAESPYIASRPFAAVRNAVGLITITLGALIETAAGGGQNGNLEVVVNAAGDGIVPQVTGVAATPIRWQVLMTTLRRVDSLA